MILYKYLSPDRIDVLENQQIRFSQPRALNDPFEFSPALKAVLTDESIDGFMKNDFDRTLDSDLAKYGALVPQMAKAVFPEFIKKQKQQFPELLRGLNPR